MLYSDIFITQKGGIEYLCGLAIEHKQDKEQVQKLLRGLCGFVKEITPPDSGEPEKCRAHKKEMSKSPSAAVQGRHG